MLLRLPLYKRHHFLFYSLILGLILILSTIFVLSNLHFLQLVYAVTHSLSLSSSSHHDHSPHYGHDKIPLHSIAICCAWNSKFSDGILTYKIFGGNAIGKQAVEKGMKAWEENIKGIKFIEVSGKIKKHRFTLPSDIVIYFRKDSGKTAGQTINSFDNYGFTTAASITLSKGAYGNRFNNAEMEKVATHEIGHALGIGHANFKGDLMSIMVSNESEDISRCDVHAVLQANQWNLLTFDGVPHSPEVKKYVKC